ncbi:MAG: class I SAM-dependent methyltransferase [Thermoleophilaceae bacterium]
MRWIAKAAVQRGLGALPRADRLNYWFQTRVTKGLPRDEDNFRLHVDKTLEHFAAFRRHGARAPGEAHFYEFGAGWDLITPIVLSVLGVGRQTIVDIRANLRPELVNGTVARLGRYRELLEGAAGGSPAWPKAGAVETAADLERFGIRYLAPCDARATGLEAASVDCISSTFTLEHIPARDIAAILDESRRLLRPGAVISSAIDMNDHYSFFDPSISSYNFLKFGDGVWRIVNSPIHFQNRLRLPDYEGMFSAAGFDILERKVEAVRAEDRAAIERLALAPRFRDRYSTDELLVRGVTLVAVR